MIKSSWFYVKFKYAEKVSQYVFFSQRETCYLPPTSFCGQAPLATKGSTLAQKLYL